jgi:hypothetical protein
VETGFCSFTAQFHANSNHRAKKASFVEMPKPGEAKAAMKSLNGKVVDGCKLRVKKAENTTKNQPPAS